MASNFLVMRLRREPCGTYGLQELAAGGRCSHGLFSPPAKVVIISLFIHMQAVVLDRNRLGCGHPFRKPPASPGPSSPCPPCLCHLLAACCWSPAPPRGCGRWGQLAPLPFVMTGGLGHWCPSGGDREWLHLAHVHPRSPQKQCGGAWSPLSCQGCLGAFLQGPGTPLAAPRWWCAMGGCGCCDLGCLAPLWARSHVEMLLHMHLLRGCVLISSVQVF